MIESSKLNILRGLVAEATAEELVWINGFISGYASKPGSSGATAAVSRITRLTIAYGTETGNAKALSTRLVSLAKQKNINTKLVSLEQYKTTDLAKEESLVIVISTQGEGEPPAAAKKFYDYLSHTEMSFPNLSYGVIALGDSAYPQFCKAGIDVDQFLRHKGASPFANVQLCDTDYEPDAIAWFDRVVKSLSQESGNSSDIVIKPGVAKAGGGKKFYHGNVLSVVNLNDNGSDKETYHIEIESDASYEPGDALGITPQNRVSLVDEILTLAGADGEKNITRDNKEAALKHVLIHDVNLAYLSITSVQKYASLTNQEIPELRMSLLDLLRIYPVNSSEQFVTVVTQLERIAPRLYSISSSPNAHPGEVHLTVARNDFSVNGVDQYGLCSGYLADFKEGEQVRFYIHRNDQFKLPDSDKNVIMIGPGTGIAPFRSFLAERDATGATGRNWLFFGDRRFDTDFLYQTELLNWIDTDLLTKVNVAFSRDQQEKIYVQDKIRMHAAEFFQWIDGGAYLYLCGAREPMSVDVEAAIVDVIQQQANISNDEATGYLMQLKDEGRFFKDVY